MECATKTANQRRQSHRFRKGGEPSGEVFRNIPALQAGVLVRFQRARLRHLRPTPKTANVLFFSTIIYTPLRVRCFSVKVNGRQDDRYNANGDILLVGAGREGGLSPSQLNFNKGQYHHERRKERRR